uniref:Lysosome-associated membrane glycoprotein 5 n=1 Tax=Haematobia irritans TaxID=7368 RepID=A0A1L8EJ89_HAEIR
MFHNKTALFLLLSSACLITAAQISVNLSQAEIPSTVVPILPEKHKTTESTSTSTTSTSSSTSTTSTTTTTTTTTTKPPTPPKPKTTTTTTTTSTTAAPTTTKAPDTTTAAPVTTTPSPKPFPEPEVVTWNSSCIMVRMAVQLNFTYETKDNKVARGLYNIPKNAIVDDQHCDMNTTQFLQINWGPATAQHIMLMQFDNVKGVSNMTMIMFTLPLLSTDFPDAKENQTIQLVHRSGEFSAPSKMSYHCTRPQMFNLTKTIEDLEVVGTVKVHDVQVEAFRSANTSGFSTARDCDSSETSDVAPIAVGIALGALILIVLISYLCARRRSSSRGYMSF